MYETGIYDLSQFYDSKFYTGILFKTKNNRMSLRQTQEIISVLDQFKSEKQNQLKIIYSDLNLEHFQLAFQFWMICFCICFLCLISEIVKYFLM